MVRMKIQAWVEDQKGILVAFSGAETDREMRLNDDDWEALGTSIDKNMEDIDHGFRVKVTGYVYVE